MIKIYTAMLCPFCARAKNLLKARQAEYEEIDVSFKPAVRAEMRKKAGGSNSVPQIWIGATHVGGSDDLAALDHSGELDKLLADVAA